MSPQTLQWLPFYSGQVLTLACKTSAPCPSTVPKFRNASHLSFSCRTSPLASLPLCHRLLLLRHFEILCPLAAGFYMVCSLGASRFRSNVLFTVIATLFTTTTPFSYFTLFFMVCIIGYLPSFPCLSLSIYFSL